MVLLQRRYISVTKLMLSPNTYGHLNIYKGTRNAHTHTHTIEY